MCDVDQSLSALAYGFAVQIGHTVLGDDVVYVVASGYNSRTGFQCRDDAAEVLSSAGQCDDRHPSF